MCGIAGCVDQRGNSIDKDRFNRMVDIVEHRGPDDRGTFYEDNLALGHRRLSIIELSQDGHQPFVYENSYILVFNGEIYNYIELRDELEQQGVTFRTETDTEVLVAAYSVWGEDCTVRFNGMWSFVIYDRKAKKLFASRDRFGIKPFYYTEQEGKWLFSSEIKQFFEMLEEPPKADYHQLARFIDWGAIDMSSGTMFQNIYQLPQGCNLLYNLGSNEYSIKRYHDISKIKINSCGYKRACDDFYKLFRQSVELRLRADVPIGYLLSGGLDSSGIVSMADKLVGEKEKHVEQHVVSSCTDIDYYDEREYMDAVLEGKNIESHRVFPDGSRVLEELDNVIWHMDEPFGSTSMYAQWNVFREAKRQGLKVMLDGQGADEQLAGYVGFYSVLFCDLLRRFRIISFIKERHLYKKLRYSTEKHKKPESIKRLIAYAYLPDFIIRKRMKSRANNEIIRQLYQKDIQIQPLDIRNPKQYIIDSIYKPLQALLHYEDRNSMAYSIESRVPFLDYRLVENIVSWPIEYKIRKGATKAVLRDGLNDLLPDKVRYRYTKLAFATPEDCWIRDNKGTFREELLWSCDMLSELIDKDKAIEWFDSGRAISRGDFTLFRIICAAHWMRVFNVQ